MENKQLLIHVAAEALIFLGITLQFNKKHRNLRNEVRELSDKVDKLEGLLAKNTQMLQNIFGTRPQQQRHFATPQKVPNPPVNTPTNFKEERDKENKEESDKESDNESISSSDLDAEIKNELKELDLERKNKITEIKDDEDEEEEDDE